MKILCGEEQISRGLVAKIFMEEEQISRSLVAKIFMEEQISRSLCSRLMMRIQIAPKSPANEVSRVFFLMNNCDGRKSKDRFSFV